MRSAASVSMSIGTPLLVFMHSLLELVDNTPEMFEVKVLKSPTRPEVAGEEVVLVGEFENTNCSLEYPSWLGSEDNEGVFSRLEEAILFEADTFSGDLFNAELLCLESVGSGNSNR